MQKALYFPHTEIVNPTIIKNALLLWDSVETIVPSHDWVPNRRPIDWLSLSRDLWKPNRRPTDKLFSEATELIVRRRVPTDRERREAHSILEGQARAGLLANLIRDSPAKWRGRKYLVYPQKFSEETWALLRDNGMLMWGSALSDYGVPNSIGYFMMSILADVCAGTQIQKITDRAEAYAWIAEHYATTLRTQYIRGLDVSEIAPNHDRLVSLSVEAMDARAIPLKKLVEMRKRELRRSGRGLSAMRRRYLAALDAHITRVAAEARSEGDVKELNRQFKEDLKQDLAHLKAELGLASLKTLFSKEVALPALIFGGSLLAPIPGLTTLATKIGAIGIIPLLKAAVDLRAARGEALRKHTMSWLFLGTQKRVSLR